MSGLPLHRVSLRVPPVLPPGSEVGKSALRTGSLPYRETYPRPAPPQVSHSGNRVLLRSSASLREHPPLHLQMQKGSSRGRLSASSYPYPSAARGPVKMSRVRSPRSAESLRGTRRYSVNRTPDILLSSAARTRSNGSASSRPGGRRAIHHSGDISPHARIPCRR